MCRTQSRSPLLGTCCPLRAMLGSTLPNVRPGLEGERAAKQVWANVPWGAAAWLNTQLAKLLFPLRMLFFFFPELTCIISRWLWAGWAEGRARPPGVFGLPPNVGSFGDGQGFISVAAVAISLQPRQAQAVEYKPVP